MNWLVYLIECADGSLYCGITNRPIARFAAHQQGKGTRYTKMRGVKQMRQIICCLTQKEALQWEHRVKKMSVAQKRALFIQGSLIASVF